METDKSLKAVDQTLGEPPSIRGDGGFPPIMCVCAGAHGQFEGARMLPYGPDTQHQK